MNLPKYLNTEKQEDILTDTITFLENVIGCYIKVDIKNNRPSISLWLNKHMIKYQGLSDNARCYTQWSIPNQSREYGIWKVYDELCNERVISDKIIFIAVGDFPIIHKNRLLHPHCDRYTELYEGIYPNQLYPIYSRSIISELHYDLLFPTRDFIDVVYGVDNLVANVNKDFINKKSVAVFRGSITGNDRTIENTRIKARILALKYPDLLDVELTKTFEYYMFESPELCIFTEIQDKRIYDPNKTGINLSGFEQFQNFKYILHIDGFVSAWRMALELMSYSVILKVDSPWIEHYYKYLKPWIHYIPIKADLSDLVQIICWCNDNIDKCIQIATNAYNFGIENLSKKKLFDWIEGIDTYCNDPNNYISIIQPQKEELNKYNVLPLDIYFDNPIYKRYLLPQIQEEIIPSLFDKDYYEFEVDKRLCEEIDSETISSSIRKKMRLEPESIRNTSFITNFSDIYNEKVKEIEHKLLEQIKLKQQFDLKIIQTNHIFSNYAIYKTSELFKKMRYMTLIVFLDDNGGYTLDSLEKTYIKAQKGKAILFDLNTNFIDTNELTISSQLVFTVIFEKPYYNNFIKKFEFVEAECFINAIRKLQENIEDNNVNHTSNIITFKIIEKIGILGGAWYWINVDLLYNENNKYSLKFSDDLVGEFYIELGEKKFTDFYFEKSNKIYKPDEYFSNLNDIFTNEYNLIINFNNEIFKDTDNKFTLKYKSFVLRNDLRKFIAEL